VSGFLEDIVTDEIVQMYNQQADQNAFLKADVAVQDAMQAAEQSGMAIAAGPMDESYSPPPSKPKYTEDQLTMMPDWIEVSKRMYRVMEGYEFIGSDKQAAAYGLDLMSEFNWNVTGPAGFPGDAGISSPGMIGQVWNIVNSGGYTDLDGNLVTRENNANDFLFMLNTYADTKTEGATIKRSLRALFGAPETYGSIGGGLAAPFIKGAAMKTSSMTARQMLMLAAKTAGYTTQLAKRKPATSGAVAGIAYADMYEGGQMILETAAGAPPSLQEAVTRALTTTAAGAAIGGTLGKLLGSTAEEVGPAVREGVVSAGEAAEARMAERGPLASRVMSGVDPMEVIDPALAAAGKMAKGADPVFTPRAEADAPVIGVPGKYTVNNPAYEPVQLARKNEMFVAAKMTPNNFEAQTVRLDEISNEFPDPLASTQGYVDMMSKTLNRQDVPAPPVWMIEHANDMNKWSDWFKQLTPDQIKAANEGLAVQTRFRDAYAAGAGPELTGQLMLWSILSRMLSAFPHESGYKDLAEKAMPFIKKAADGQWSDADTTAWLDMVKTTIPAGSPGRSATSNANAFGKTFLPKMAVADASGKTALVRLHEMIANPEMSSREIRRAYYGLAEDTGIKNKILSFALLVSGRNDVVVLDRIQINQMWGGGEKIYDDIMQQFDTSQGLAQYEALERSLMSRVPELYKMAGRTEPGTVGRYHWESWVRSSGQVVSHPTLETIVRTSAGEQAPVAGVPVMEGRFHQKLSGAKYEKLPDGSFRYIYETSDGTPYSFTKDELNATLDKALAKNSEVIPPDFPRTKAGKGSVEPFEGGSIPWYEFKGVNRGKLDELIRAAGTKIE
jgi:hypothetical protein